MPRCQGINNLTIKRRPSTPFYLAESKRIPYWDIQAECEDEIQSAPPRSIDPNSRPHRINFHLLRSIAGARSYRDNMRLTYLPTGHRNYILASLSGVNKSFVCELDRPYFGLYDEAMAARPTARHCNFAIPTILRQLMVSLPLRAAQLVSQRNGNVVDDRNLRSKRKHRELSRERPGLPTWQITLRFG